MSKENLLLPFLFKNTIVKRSVFCTLALTCTPKFPHLSCYTTIKHVLQCTLYIRRIPFYPYSQFLLHFQSKSQGKKYDLDIDIHLQKPYNIQYIQLNNRDAYITDLYVKKKLNMHVV